MSLSPDAPPAGGGSMKFAWDTILPPLIETLKPKRLVEVGAFLGDGTRPMLAHCRAVDGLLHVVDPLSADPELRRQQLDIFETLARDNPDHLRFHREPSLPLLDRIGPYDAIFLDGDHNWFTVIEELRAVERMALASGIVPLIVLDDIGWPHGRRDAYFAPEAIPAEHRHPHRRGGLVPGQSALVDGGGPFAQFLHAEHEGGPRNGVRTALEDFLAETSLDLVCREIPLRSGTAVVLPRDESETSAQINQWLDAWSFGETQKGPLWRMSAELIALVNTIGPLSQEVVALRRAVAERAHLPANSA
jgi:predicted O-methyltransferase YrrM